MFHGLFVVSVAKPFGLTQNADDHFITTVISSSAVLEGTCRFFWASLVDRYGFRPVCLVFAIV